MGRALVIVALLMAWPAAARADTLDDLVAGLGRLGGDCQVGLDLANLLLESGDLGEDERAQVEGDQMLMDYLCPTLRESDSMAQETLASFRDCTGDVDVCDQLQVMVMMWVEKAQAEAMAMAETILRLVAIRDGEGVAQDDPSDTMHTITLSTIGVSIEVPGTWEVSDGDGSDLILEGGEMIAAVMTTSEYDCATAIVGVSNNYEDHRDASISLPYAWSGIDYEVDGARGGFYCGDREGAALIVSAPAEIAAVLIGGIEAALGPSSTETTDTDTLYVQPPDGVRRETPRRGGVIGGFMPRTAQVGFVRRADDMGSGFGFGLQLGRLGWREGYRFTIGYEVAAAATTGFWELGAQVRPSVSPMLSDLPIDAYVALGVDVTGGSHQEETDVQPVAGAGAEVLFTLPGIGADLAAQALADPGGFHSYTLHGGVLFGANEGRFRIGASYVKFADDTKLLWMTLGFTKLELN